MNIVRTYNPNRLWPFRTSYMEDNCHIEFPRRGDPCPRTNDVNLHHMFENTVTLAHNQWIGVWRVSSIDGSYNQYLVSVAANSQERAHKAVWKAINKEIAECDCQECKDLEPLMCEWCNELNDDCTC